MYQLASDQVDPEIEMIMQACMVSTKVTGLTLFPEVFYTKFCDLHEQIFSLVDSGKRKIAIAAPRGIGKTSIARTVANRFILFRLSKFICYVMNSATVAEMQTENIKMDLLSTPEVRHYFGNVKTDVADDLGMESFSKTAWTAFGEILILPRGAGQQIRGLNWRNHRPELIIVDDLENAQEIRSAENRINIKKWFHSDLMKSVDRYSDNYIIIYIDTLKHEDSLLAELLEDPEWASIRLSLGDFRHTEESTDSVDNLYSNVPTYITDEQIRAEYTAHERRGDLDTFYSEYMNQPTSLADASFDKRTFRHYRETDPAFEPIHVELENIMIVDPAKTVKMQSADSAIIIFGLALHLSRYYIRDTFSDKVFPDQLYDNIFRLVLLYRIQTVGIEVTSLNQFIVQPIKNEMAKRGIYFNLIELKAQGSKEERIRTVVPYYRNGYVYHNIECCGKLEDQLVMFPKSRLWDLMDCVGYLPKMLELGERYFQPPADPDNPESEFEELETEYEPALADWRVC